MYYDYAYSIVRPVWRVNCLIKLFATDGSDTSRVCLPPTGHYTSRDFRSRFDAVTGRAEVF